MPVNAANTYYAIVRLSNICQIIFLAALQQYAEMTQRSLDQYVKRKCTQAQHVPLRKPQGSEEDAASSGGGLVDS